MGAQTLVFEIGVEEIPAMPLYSATEKLKTQAAEALDNARIAHGDVMSCSTPRRIILKIDNVAETSKELVQKAKGPAAKIAFDNDGNPTKAAIGFARGKGLEVDALVRETDKDGNEYVYANINEPAQSTKELLPAILCDLISGMSWPRSQRWGSLHVTFSRPIRWLLALLGQDVIDLEYAGLKSDRKTYGHRFMAHKSFEIASADDFFNHFDEMKVIPCAKKREDIIRQQIEQLENETGFRADLPKSTFAEVINLVEWPTALLCHFDEEFLQVPPEIITDAMLEHQRYFPMYDKNDQLTNAFIVISNGDPAYNEQIAQGNERVVRARLADAKFFVDEDEREPLSAYVDKLKNVVFQEKLGSVKEKQERIEKIAEQACELGNFNNADKKDAMRAAHLCKADLVTQAVVEFSSLQGIMGGHYALASGESKDVAIAITDHYRPRFAGDELPRNMAGKLVAMADKLDSIAGIFAIDQAPTGSSDPFALRRACIGIINILLGSGELGNKEFGNKEFGGSEQHNGEHPDTNANKADLDISLERLIDVALDNYNGKIEFEKNKIAAQIKDFFAKRLEVIAKEKGFAPDCIQAVLALGLFEPKETLARIQALHNARKNDPETFENLAIAYSRAANLTDVSLGVNADESLMDTSEKTLLKAIDDAQQKVDEALGVRNHEKAIAALASLRAPIDTFFTDVLIMDEDEALKNMRLQLLNRFVAVFANVADIAKLVKKK